MAEELREKIFRLALESKWGEIENLVADGNQSKTPVEYLKHWLSISRCFGYATQDESWNEFEKEFAIIISRMLRAEAKYKTFETLLQETLEHLTYCGYGYDYELKRPYNDGLLDKVKKELEIE